MFIVTLHCSLLCNFNITINKTDGSIFKGKESIVFLHIKIANIF